ncbi:ATP-dependent RNA helicase HrpA [Aurantivibrio infirmus]
MTNPDFSISSLRQDISTCLVADRFRLQKQLSNLLARQKQKKPFDQVLLRLTQAIQESHSRVERRRKNVPLIEFPDELPIAQKREDITKAIESNQVVVVAGETGSGKTTQLPKICLQLGRGVFGTIGHTQPRRIAARTVANRIAEELKVELGSSVGYQVRFTDHSSEDTHIKLMTDGILLAEIQNDRYLNRYDTIIIDEAHERSLNIDFLLGYLKQLLPKRPDLKVIITSATIDVERLSQHFNNAPIIQVSGRTYPVDVIYRPRIEEDSITDALVGTIDEILAVEKKSSTEKRGDILVFLSGERDIREAALAIRKANFPHLDVLPLYARLSLAEQTKVFQNHKGRRVVLATNVAETSITVPGIRYVIDPGYARISRYSYRTKVLRLPIEAISQASANQRKGRSGRMSDGVCYRLYEQTDFDSRAEFTEPEIARSNLATVILQMAQLGLGDIRDFPFVDVPDHRLINDGYKLLEELQALDKRGRLTPIGKQLTQLSVDPRLARMCIAAAELDCLREVLLIVSALTIQDPRDRPADKQQAADEKHRRFAEKGSDFLAYINLWNYLETLRQEVSQNQLRNRCKKEFLSFLRIREWRDLHHQLRLATKKLGFRENKQSASLETVHRALLVGLLGNIGNLDEQRQYIGPRNRRFSIFPGSSLFKASPKWIAASELIETTKLYAHCVAKVEPEWILESAKHLIKRNYFEPHYESRRGQVMAFARTTLYGVVLEDKKPVDYSHIDPKEAREIFIQAALVEAKYQSPRGKNAKFFQHNQALIKELLDLEAKSRRRDVIVEDRELFQFFDERIPSKVVNLQGFEHWRKQAEQDSPKLLFITRDLLMRHDAEEITQAQFPNELQWKDRSYPLSYHFEPGHKEDGVSIHVPIHALHLVPENRLQWLVPGMFREKCIQLVKSLPKQWRKNFVPVPDFVDRILPKLIPSDDALSLALANELKKISAVDVPESAWNESAVDDYYRFNIKVLDEKGKIVDSNRDLNALRASYRDRLQKSIRSAGDDMERKNIVEWDFEELKETVHLKKGGITTVGYSALVDNGASVDLRLFDDPAQAEYAYKKGLTRLLLLEFKQATKYLTKSIFSAKNIALALSCFENPASLKEDLLCAAVFDVCVGSAPLPRNKNNYHAAIERGKENFVAKATELERMVLELARGVVAIQASMVSRNQSSLFVSIKKDIGEQIRQLFRPGFLFSTPMENLQQLPRYLLGIEKRLEKADSQIQKDLERQEEFQVYASRLADYWNSGDDWILKSDAELEKYRWMLEEFRLSLFAQPMKTRFPISPKRLDKQWALIERQRSQKN